MAAASVLLVHGAWHGAWCWEQVEQGLGAAGVEVQAVDLPGHGADSGPLLDLAGDAAFLTGVLDDLDSGTVLVGHSYGGAVISEAGGHPNVGHLVYLAAFALDVGESCAGAAVDEAAKLDLSHEGRPDLAEAIVFGDDGLTTIDPEMAPSVFYHRCSPDVAAWAVAQLGQHSMASLGQEASTAAWREVPSTYAVCADDSAVHPELQRIMAGRCAESVEWDADHSPFLSTPSLVVDLLRGLVG
jgi:pimeloyl-ACP methyl ester carboxylesterase